MKKILIILFYLISISINAQTLRVVSGIDTILTEATGYDITPHTTKWQLTIKNSLFSSSVSGYFLYCGDDAWFENSAGNFDGTVISGNKLVYTGSTSDVHTIIAGFNVNYHIKFNYFLNTPYTVVNKQSKYHPQAYTTGGFSYNIIKNSRHIRTGGTNGLRIYNNTFYIDKNWTAYDECAILLGAQNDTSVSSNIKIKNNIFYRKIDGYMLIIGTDCEVGLECDYNVYWNEGGDGTIKIMYGGNTKTWAEWRALGFDTHSVIMNPNFIDTINFVPTSRLNYGVNLDSLHSTTQYDYGLSTTADWTVGLHPDTTIQNGIRWQVGSRIYDSPLSSTAHYVATDGDDADSGSFDNPWATWQKAFNTADAGDTVYFRGGVYMPASKVVPGAYPITRIDPLNGYGNNGTYDNPICFFNYPGEVPILDGSLASSAGEGNIGLNVNNATYIKFRGLTVRNILMLNTTANSSGIESINNAEGIHSNMWWENMTVHNVGGAGFWLAGCDTLYVTNCDAYNNCDSLDNMSPGGDGDGFNLTHGGASADTFKIIYVNGCRAWNNSDDGFDIGGTKQLQVTNSWSFRNGYHYVYSVGHDSSGYYGDGNGFKLASSDLLTASKRQFKNLITASNLHFGLSTANLVDSLYGPFGEYYNIFSYSNEMSILEGQGLWNGTEGGYGHHIYRNILSYNFSSAYHALFLADYAEGQLEFDHSNWTRKVGWPYWEIAITVTDADFISLNTLQLDDARKTDGSLPDITFGRLVGNSDLIGVGADIGMTAIPDIGIDWAYYDLTYGAGNEVPPTGDTIPTIYSNTISSLKSIEAVSGGNITSDGGATVTERGIVYGTSVNPTTSNNKIVVSGTTGLFSTKLWSLRSNTTYHVRSYATNSVGTSYGADVSFTTKASSPLSGGEKVYVMNGKIMVID
jgi:hypothetical protein